MSKIRVVILVFGVMLLAAPVVTAAEPDAGAVETLREELQTHLNMVWTCSAAIG